MTNPRWIGAVGIGFIVLGLWILGFVGCASYVDFNGNRAWFGDRECVRLGLPMVWWTPTVPDPPTNLPSRVLSTSTLEVAGCAPR